ncbi:MAG: transglutaminase family protein, partial [Patulibacter sp.]|nr:transglutaminase family protein [Patulibacter sp.]
MSIKVALEHRTAYRYDRKVSLGPQTVRLRPAPHTRTPILSYSLSVTPEDHFVNWQQDPVGNFLARLIFEEKTDEFSVVVNLVADMAKINPFDFFVDDEIAEWSDFAYPPELKAELKPYLKPGKPGPLLADWLKGAETKGKRSLDVLVDLNKRVANSVGYSVRMEPGVQTPEVTLDRAVGSCRDSAWLLVHALRNLGVAARFASGYLIQLAEDIPPRTGSYVKQDFTDLHAWAEAYVPGAGWIGLDATSGLLTGEGHIPLACSADPTGAAPISGAIEANVETEFEFANLITRVDEPPRVTKPYTDDQWERIDSLGRAVDLRLRGSDTRLTMGGEPTFISETDMDAPEWNIAADGGNKHELAVDLALRLADRFAPGALIRHAQGKWYPGEPIPRWQIGINWRTDGKPLWGRKDLLADPSSPGTATHEQVKRLAEAVLGGLGIETGDLVPAYEDKVQALLDEAKLPGGEPPILDEPDPDDPRWRDAEGRAALIAELDGDLGQPTGWALPIHRDESEAAWRSGRWHLRRGRLNLIPGDSPIGFRLPLQALTWILPYPEEARSQFAAVRTLPDPVVLQRGTPRPSMPKSPAPVTALCFELRDGHPRVFLPPIVDAVNWVELIGVIEAAATKVGVPIAIEGYAPPHDPTLRNFDVTPDPGVIEVNIHPSETWDELSDKAFTLAEEAREVGLTTEKFALDGLASGSGGGSHLTLGGRTPPDSPFLRRPDLLRSMITYWQHHPSLSYLFSGRFIGPTSQAPRVDEARHENLYELEIAFAEMDRLSTLGSPPAWQVDRLLRNLLTDLTGNTHRAEFCIDKMYNPGSESGRLGVVELRGFEMAPHPRMAMVQQLLVRALVARHWADPYRGDLVRWGTDLHDRFLLPWWVEHVISDVVDDLRRAGIRFEHEWL